MNGVRVLAAAHPPELAVVVRMSDADPRTYRVAAARGGARCHVGVACPCGTRHDHLFVIVAP